MAGIMDFFKPAPAASAPAPQGQPQQTAPNGQPASTTPPANGGNAPAPQGTNNVVNPLDAYTSLWNNTGKAAEAPPAYVLDSKTLTDVSNGLDFTQGISPELMQQATTGDAKALLQIIQHVGKQAYQTSMSHNSALTDKFVAARSAYDLNSVGSKVKSELTSSALANVPNYAHPVVQKELTRIANAMQAENPDSSPQQIADAATKYFMEIQSAMNPAPSAEAQAAAKGDIDWGNYFNKS